MPAWEISEEGSSLKRGVQVIESETGYPAFFVSADKALGPLHAGQVAALILGLLNDATAVRPLEMTPWTYNESSGGGATMEVWNGNQRVCYATSEEFAHILVECANLAMGIEPLEAVAEMLRRIGMGQLSTRDSQQTALRMAVRIMAGLAAGTPSASFNEAVRKAVLSPEAASQGYEAALSRRRSSASLKAS